MAPESQAPPKLGGSSIASLNEASHESCSGSNPLPKYLPDIRIANVNNLPNRPFQLTGLTPCDFYTADPNHGFFPEWQEADCDTAHATSDNPSGCLNDLFPWAEATRNANGIGGGSVALGFYARLCPYL
jgi:phospholipase C